jgi:5-formyltetrahydrofolate cyclo-ligase
VRGYLKHHGEAALDRRDGAHEHLRGRVSIAHPDPAHPVLPGPVRVVVAHQFVDHPAGDARVLQPCCKGVAQGKVLYMAVPRLADELPFYLLDPEHLSISPWEAAAKEGAAKVGRKVAATELPSVDLVVCGSVAVNREGARIGKGGGFSDLEVAFLVEAGVIRPDTILATTVHPLQVVDEPLPETIHDFRVDLIVTPDEAIWCAKPHRPPGILWDHLDQDKIAAVPALAALAAGR